MRSIHSGVSYITSHLCFLKATLCQTVPLGQIDSLGRKSQHTFLIHLSGHACLQIFPINQEMIAARKFPKSTCLLGIALILKSSLIIIINYLCWAASECRGWSRVLKSWAETAQPPSTQVLSPSAARLYLFSPWNWGWDASPPFLLLLLAGGHCKVWGWWMLRRPSLLVSQYSLSEYLSFLSSWFWNVSFVRLPAANSTEICYLSWSFCDLT